MGDHIRIKLNVVLEYDAPRPHFPDPSVLLLAVAKAADADGWLEGGRITFSRAAKPKSTKPRTFAQSIARKAARRG